MKGKLKLMIIARYVHDICVLAVAVLVVVAALSNGIECPQLRYRIVVVIIVIHSLYFIRLVWYFFHCSLLVVHDFDQRNICAHHRYFLLVVAFPFFNFCFCWDIINVLNGFNFWSCDPQLEVQVKRVCVFGLISFRSSAVSVCCVAVYLFYIFHWIVAFVITLLLYHSYLYTFFPLHLSPHSIRWLTFAQWSWWFIIYLFSSVQIFLRFYCEWLCAVIIIIACLATSSNAILIHCVFSIIERSKTWTWYIWMEMIIHYMLIHPQTAAALYAQWMNTLRHRPISNFQPQFVQPREHACSSKPINET